MAKIKLQIPNAQGVKVQGYSGQASLGLWILLLLALIFSSGFFYWLGASGYALPLLSGGADSLDLQGDTTSTRAANRELTKELTRLQRAAEIEAEAGVRVKKMLQEKDLEIMKLTDELMFYRSLLQPDQVRSGLQIKKFSLRGAEQGEYYYDLLLTQSAPVTKLVKGNVVFSIDGRQAGQMHRLDFADIATNKGNTLKYSFKYFQRLYGVFTLPQGFEPVRVLIELLPENGKNTPVQFSYAWKELIGSRDVW